MHKNVNNNLIKCQQCNFNKGDICEPVVQDVRRVFDVEDIIKRISADENIDPEVIAKHCL